MPPELEAGGRSPARLDRGSGAGLPALFDGPGLALLGAGLDAALPGDSGAPVFAERNRDPAVVGVVSWSAGPDLSDGCGSLAGLTPLAPYRAWIVDTAASMGSPLP